MTSGFGSSGLRMTQRGRGIIWSAVAQRFYRWATALQIASTRADTFYVPPTIPHLRTGTYALRNLRKRKNSLPSRRRRFISCQSVSIVFTMRAMGRGRK